MLENTEGVMKKDNPEKMVNKGTQDTGQINVIEYRKGNGLSFFITPSVFSNIYLCCTLCTLCGQFLWIVPFFLLLSVFSNICLSCILCTLFTSRPYPYVTKTLKLQCHNDLHKRYSDIRYQNAIITFEVLRYYQDHIRR
jgi:hypothetical protein